MRRAGIGAAALAAMLAPAAAQAGRCVLEVRHHVYLDGPCEIATIDARGSFTIGVSDVRRSPYFAYVYLEAGGARGVWNETPDSNHAESDLGPLRRHGACWENARARVCAWK